MKKIIEEGFSFPLKKVNIVGTNGLVEHQGKLWVADLLGGQIIGFDQQTGKIFATYTKAFLKSAPDDLCFINDTTFAWTSFFTGEVKVTTFSGQTTLLASAGKNVNPIAKIPNKDAVAVSFSVGNNQSLLEINVLNGQIDTIVKNIPAINGFDISEDGILYAPITDNASFLGKGKILRVDIKNKTFEIITPNFPGMPSKEGFLFATGIVVGDLETIYVLQSLNPVSVYKVDAINEVAILKGELTQKIGDNICLDKFGNILVSTFIGNEVVEINNTNGSIRTIKIKN
jgi:outer membrane protein assembly factor BamB